MLKALDTIVSFLKMIVQFVILIIQHIINFITNIPTYLNFGMALINMLPDFVKWFMVAAVIYILIESIVRKIRGSD